MAKRAPIYSCSECDAQSPKWLGRCPECGAWNSLAEEMTVEAGPASLQQSSGASPIDQIGLEDSPRISCGLPQLDRVLGGGIVPGGMTLIGGEPGIGKSTLLLQVANRLAERGPVLYVSGEESPTQIAIRARRLGTMNGNIAVLADTSVEKIISELESRRPVAAIIDSIQTMQTSTNASAPGSVGQVRDSAGLLLSVSKRYGIPVFLIGHVTKEGTIAGPKTLEHIVDTVVYFEGDKFQDARIIRAFKNRFGAVNEIALFRMHDSGLEEIANPSAVLLSQRSAASGSAIVAALEGTRSILVEVQALVTPTHFPSPRRVGTGIDSNRLAILLAVLERRCGESFVTHDVYVSIAGGIEIDEPALDLGIVAALVSSKRDRPIPWDAVMFGEVGLLGEIRGISQPALRGREAAALGFKRVFVSSGDGPELDADLLLEPVRTIDQFIKRLFG